MLKNLKSLIGTTVIALGALAISGQAAQAATLGPSWTYTMDSFKDGTGHNSLVGNTSTYEVYGMAMRAKGGILSVAFNANVGINGHAENVTGNGNVTWGDLFFNFSGASFKDAEAAGKLFGVRFSSVNDAGVSSTGVFSNVTTKNVAGSNSGHSTLQNYTNSVAGRHTSTGESGVVGYGDLTNAEAKDYLTKKNGTVQDTSNSIGSVINSGNKIGDITALSDTELVDLVSGFSSKGGVGSQTFGFSFAESLLPKGDSIASILLECLNDGLIAKANIVEQPTGPNPEVPEPITMSGLLLAGAGLVGAKRRQKA